MALVQGGFLSRALLKPEKFGIRRTDEEMGYYCFVWRVMGYCQATSLWFCINSFYQLHVSTI